MVRFSSIKREIFSKYGKDKINAIIFYGSRARGDNTKNSDYDIGVHLSNTNKKALDIYHLDGKFQISVLDKREFREMKKKGHPFLYTSFRDGIVLHQKEEWFDKMQKEILSMKPDKEVLQTYLRQSLQELKTAHWRVIGNIKSKMPILGLEVEDGKVAANKFGFALMMFNGKYPHSPRTLKKEVIALDTKYRAVGESIEYLQQAHYELKEPSKKVYAKNLMVLYEFGKELVRKNFPAEYNSLIKFEGVYEKIDKSSSST